MATVFISWSGERSKKIGEALREWIPSVIQLARPYFTPTDIEKGQRWAAEIQKELAGAKIGVFIITPENISNPWLLFEAGAISREIDGSSVCTLLFDVNPIDLTGPLQQFQATVFDRSEARKLIESINNKLEGNKLPENVLSNVFDKWWPDLESKISEIMAEDDQADEEKKRSDRDLLEEIVEQIRGLRSWQAHSRSMSAGRAVIATIEALDEILFLTFSNPETIKKQVKALRKLENYIPEIYDFSQEEIDQIERMVGPKRRVIEASLNKVKNTDPDDDIPF